MFKAKTISGSRGNTYFIEKELAIRKSVRHLAVINDSGDSMLCISVDLKKSSIDPKLLPYGQLSDGLVHADEPAPSASMRPNVRRLMGEHAGSVEKNHGTRARGDSVWFHE